MNRWLSAFKNLRFRQKLVLSYLIVILIPLMTLGLYSFNQSKLFLRMQAEQGLRATVSTMAESLNSKMVWYDGIIKSIVSNAGFHKIFSNHYLDLTVMAEDIRNVLEPYFNTVLYLNKEIEQMTVYSKGMPEFGDYMKDKERVLEEAWFNEALKSKQTEWSSTGQAIIAARAFPDIYVNKNISVLYIRLSQNQVLAEIGKSNLDQYGIVISDDQQRIVFANRDTAHSAAADRVASDASDASDTPNASNASNASNAPNSPNAASRDQSLRPEEVVKLKDGLVKIAGVSYIVIQKPIALPGWTLHCYIPVNMIAADAGSIMKATLVVVLICLLTLLVLIWIFSHTMLKPIRHLNKKMIQVEDGNLHVVVHSSAKDEIGELTNRFGHMLNRINELIQEMYQNKIIQKEAELKALQSQINPHFLYNSLSIIHWKAIQIEADDIGHIVTSLSRFYRTALNKGSNVISIRNEMDNIRSYLDIQLIMHDHSFDAVFSIDEQIYEYDMINLVLQPIVENAIDHGIDLKTEGRGCLTIRGTINGDYIAIDIEDNGPGIEPGLMEQLLSAHSDGYGLKNVHERIRLFFGEQYGITIESEPGAGTCMKLLFPKFKG
ncbi:sensor histidine kinase [Paenibacillus eucommiae]|uniref:histidine kinase n=1 Tax=Paenibacillus eucommiae TaxID=1355755 RepID=A0ABS4INQ0_9BACL|nr:histidine kinase [Paenibacillus eucommiae]MBP1988795.1 two-component system sensor histidine kinase YesM [Paenibacillus eucommiae]